MRVKSVFIAMLLSVAGAWAYIQPGSGIDSMTPVSDGFRFLAATGPAHGYRAGDRCSSPGIYRSTSTLKPP